MERHLVDSKNENWTYRVLNQGQYVSIKELKEKELPHSSSIRTQNDAETGAASVSTKMIQKQDTLSSYFGSKSEPNINFSWHVTEKGETWNGARKKNVLAQTSWVITQGKRVW